MESFFESPKFVLFTSLARIPRKGNLLTFGIMGMNESCHCICLEVINLNVNW